MKLCYEFLDKLQYINGKIVKKDIYNNKKRTVSFNIGLCKYCGEEFISYSKDSKFCDSSCSFSYTHSNMSNEDKKMFREKISKTKKDSSNIPWNKRVFNYTPYTTYENKIGWIDKVRVSKKYDNALETKCEYCGKWFLPTLEQSKARVNAVIYKQIDRTKFYCSDNCKNACPIFNKHSNVVNKDQGTSREVNSYLRQIVLKRDNYTCTKCKSQDSELHCHHIYPLNESPIESEDPDNCKTVCKACHIEIHKKNSCKYNDLKC